MSDEAFLLELLNTTPLIDGERRDEVSADWLRAHGGTGSDEERQATVAARDVLQRLVLGATRTDALTSLLVGAIRRPAVTGSGVEWVLEVPAERRLAVRAVLAWDELRRTSPGRLRPCENSECTLFLIDHSKPNRARWCSMALCGNRMKARRHYERTRRAAATD
jgi:predicted RNA-binding Zn ribbon-like protein